MPLDDEWIERYSRQIVLAEVGAEGQLRLGASRVAIVGSGGAAEQVIAYLAAAGVGWIAADPALHALADPGKTDLTLASSPDATERLDAVVVSSPTLAGVAALWQPFHERGAAIVWIAAGMAGGFPPCPSCAAAGLAAPPTAPELETIRDRLLGTLLATEVVKSLLAIGAPLAGRVLTYDPGSATVTSLAVRARPDCGCATSSA